MSSPTARTLKALRELGYLADVAEKRVPKTRVTRDLFGFIDIVAIKAGEPILAVQATSDEGGGHGHARVKKIRGECQEAARAWLGACGRIEVWAWRKLKRSGDKWEPRITEITEAML